tara:strand:- start:166 stop:492 length:327 start_codon:yes stop_codon:yes gene_type:complete
MENNVENIENSFKEFQRNFASWHVFACGKMPIVSYRASSNGVNSLDVVSDLSHLDETDQAAMCDILMRLHGSALVNSLENLIREASWLHGELTNGNPDSPQEEFGNES